jgi:hypothetical protein
MWRELHNISLAQKYSPPPPPDILFLEESSGDDFPSSSYRNSMSALKRISCFSFNFYFMKMGKKYISRVCRDLIVSCWAVKIPAEGIL